MINKFQDYASVLDFLYTQLPMFQRIGGAAYKKDLTNTIALCDALGNPEKRFKSIHIAGTNGKGSSSHYTASILQEAGFKTGLYTSPHLKNFTERIKINGSEMPSDKVLEFVNNNLALIENVKPSFFEITVAMAFDYFANEQVDIAVIEVGMGGRLDSTNIITPEVALITNISMDHQQWLGNDLATIAKEKAGIIKGNVPVVVSETQREIKSVFTESSQKRDAPLYFADNTYQCNVEKGLKVLKEDREVLHLQGLEMPVYQEKNLPGVFKVIELLQNKGFKVSDSNIAAGLKNMSKNTGLKGRWQVLQHDPKVICDVGHNHAGVELIMRQLKREVYHKLHIVWGTVNDKDVTPILQLLPTNASYYFCQADIPRALSAIELKAKANHVGLTGNAYNSVNKALQTALSNATKQDLILVGGSTFTVAELELL